MKLILSSIVVAAFVLLCSQPAQAQEVCPGNMAPTIAALQDCVEHALTVGHIDNAGIADSLLSKLDSAQDAENRHQTRVAIALLNAFIHEVEAQEGKHIDQTHAEHMMDHAGEVIAALESIA